MGVFGTILRRFWRMQWRTKAIIVLAVLVLALMADRDPSVGSLLFAALPLVALIAGLLLVLASLRRRF